MSIQRIDITSDHKLEGILVEKSPYAGVVICHPHPLYGGDMHNNVVMAMEEGFTGCGFSTLRFNFRGVGRSGGDYDEGEGEARDVIAAAECLRATLGGNPYLLLAGYSFGAWVCARAAADLPDVAGLFLVSYPFAFYDPAPLLDFKRTLYLVGGEYDDIGPVEDLMKTYKAIQILDKHLKIIPTSHFYGGKEEELSLFIRERVSLPDQRSYQR